MSLKGFHVLFIAVSILLAIGAGAWGLRSHAEEANPLHLAFGIGSLVAAVALGIYGAWFVRKIRSSHYP